MALSGTRAFELIQGSYAATLPSFIVLWAALYHEGAHKIPGTLTLATGIGLWLYEIIRNIVSGGADTEVLSPGFPMILLVLCFVVYWTSDWVVRRLASNG